MYLCYVDESGNLDVNVAENCSDGQCKPALYVLSGLCVLDHKWPTFSGIIDGRKDELIQKLWRTKGLHLNLAHAELKSTWIRIPKQREKRPFLASISDGELASLVSLCYQQLEYAKMTVFAIVIDKSLLHEYFDRDKLHRKAWELLLERVENFMTERHSKHKVMFIKDDVSRETNQNLALKHLYMIKTHASSGCRLSHVVETPMFARSELSNGIQLADLVAYNVYHAFTRKDPTYEHFQRILPFVYKSVQTSAYKLDGLKVFPPESDLTNIVESIKK